MSSSTSSSRRRRFHMRRHPPVVVDIGCSCRKPKLFSFMHNYLPLSIKNNNKSLTGASSNKTRSESSTTCSSSTLTTTITNSTFSPCHDDTSTTSSSYAGPAGRSPKNKKKKKKKKKAIVAEESVAVEKVSSDPYLDFKDSMLQMILEKEIYQWDELRELLNLFLSLNSPYHHHLILRAFAEIWEGVFSPAAAAAARQS